jgi:DNA-binding transcriptional LysR family regulator
MADAELFCAVVDAGGISAGALALSSSPPAVSRRLSALETHLGVRLADRSARRFRLTAEGVLYTSIADVSWKICVMPKRRSRHTARSRAAC